MLQYMPVNTQKCTYPCKCPAYRVEYGQVNLPYEPSNKSARRQYGLQFIEEQLKIRWEEGYMKPFKLPVNEDNSRVPGYYAKIKHPMDMGTVLKRLEHNYYDSYDACFRDMNLVVENCKFFHHPSTNNVFLAKQLGSAINEISQFVKGNKEACKKLVPMEIAPFSPKRTGSKARSMSTSEGTNNSQSALTQATRVTRSNSSPAFGTDEKKTLRTNDFRLLLAGKQKTADQNVPLAEIHQVPPLLPAIQAEPVHRPSKPDLVSPKLAPAKVPSVAAKKLEKLRQEKEEWMKYMRERDRERSEKLRLEIERDREERIAEFERLEYLRLMYNAGYPPLIEPKLGYDRVIMVNTGYDPYSWRNCFDE
ncbi:Hypothetical predicted protein [Cloeon dipterum]|uniref:Bromo domain-containing protein n=1 Tax=Cloeon dipterum TaxID=197152 RepID=A0A8S1E2N4_9INSE|nr:Hypothetical predicted protein [Cloeon dipterum]